MPQRTDGGSHHSAYRNPELVQSLQHTHMGEPSRTTNTKNKGDAAPRKSCWSRLSYERMLGIWKEVGRYRTTPLLPTCKGIGAILPGMVQPIPSKNGVALLRGLGYGFDDSGTMGPFVDRRTSQ